MAVSKITGHFMNKFAEVATTEKWSASALLAGDAKALKGAHHLESENWTAGGKVWMGSEVAELIQHFKELADIS